MRPDERFRRDIAESNLLLPFAAILTLLLWATGPVQEFTAWIYLVLIAASAYIIVEWNLQCQLLRIRSRMTSAVFLCLTTLLPLNQHLTPVTAYLLPLALLSAYFVLFKGYGTYRPQGYLFHAFLFISTGSLFYPPLLLLCPTLLVSCNVQLRILRFKSFVAALLGILLPYWIYGFAYVSLQAAENMLGLFTEDALSCAAPALTWEHWTRYFTAPPSCLSAPFLSHYELSPALIPTLVLLLVLGTVSAVHFVSTSYNDKIRTRQYFYTMLLQLAPITLITLLYPEDSHYNLPLLSFAITPFVAHYFALARGKASLLIFSAVLFLLIICNHLNLWNLFINV